MINEKLAEERGLNEETIKKIEELHLKRKDYYNRMEIAPIEDLKNWDYECEMLEYELQALWGFPQDNKYHEFWRRPRCTCPTLDNRERLGTGYHIINQLCPLHGESNGISEI